MSDATSSALGFDFGTTNTVVAQSDGDTAELIMLDGPKGSDAVFRSALCFWEEGDARVALGADAGPWAMPVLSVATAFLPGPDVASGSMRTVRPPCTANKSDEWPELVNHVGQCPRGFAFPARPDAVAACPRPPYKGASVCVIGVGQCSARF